MNRVLPGCERKVPRRALQLWVNSRVTPSVLEPQAAQKPRTSRPLANPGYRRHRRLRRNDARWLNVNRSLAAHNRFDWPAAVCYFLRVFMLSTPNQSLMRLYRMRRGMAIFLLVFAFFDLTVVDVFFPQVCEDEQASAALFNLIESPDKPTDINDSGKSIDKIAAKSLPIQDHDSRSGQDSHQTPADEDCFCCCSHIIPSPHINIVALNCLPQLDDPAIFSLPLPHPHGPFHPPRLS